jgi:hypothetical protein
MRQALEPFRELILSGRKKGRLILPLSNWSHLQFNFDRDPVSKKYILQAYENATWLFTAYENDPARLVKDFDDLMSNYLCID